MSEEAKVALVTGAGVRLGRSIALALGRAGLSVAVHYHSSAGPAQEVCRELSALGAGAHAFGADLSDRDAVRKLVDDVVQHFGRLDVLVPSAALFERVELDAIGDADWDRTLAMNLTAPFVLAQRALPALRASGGTIVFITCSSATTPFRNYLPYVVAKGGLRQLMRTLALEAAPAVRVNAVAPGTVLPPESMTVEQVARLVAPTPLARSGTPADVADAVVYLASASYVTGHELVVDGGRNLARVERF